VDTLEELLDVTGLLALQPLPHGRNVAVVTNAGGLGILCADACEAAGLVLPSLADATIEELRSAAPGGEPQQSRRHARVRGGCDV
jgi:acetyltransferase